MQHMLVISVLSWNGMDASREPILPLQGLNLFFGAICPLTLASCLFNLAFCLFSGVFLPTLRAFCLIFGFLPIPYGFLPSLRFPAFPIWIFICLAFSTSLWRLYAFFYTNLSHIFNGPYYWFWFSDELCLFSELICFQSSNELSANQPP